MFCLARDCGLLDLEALTAENQAMDIDERPPWIPNWFSSSGRNATCHQAVLTLFFSLFQVMCISIILHNGNFVEVQKNKQTDCYKYILFCGAYAGQRLSTEDMGPALKMFNELLDDISQFKNKKETPWASVGHFMRSEVRRLLMTKIVFLVI